MSKHSKKKSVSLPADLLKFAEGRVKETSRRSLSNYLAWLVERDRRGELKVKAAPESHEAVPA